MIAYNRLPCRYNVTTHRAGPSRFAKELQKRLTEAVGRGPAGITAALPHLVDWIADHRNLHNALTYLRRKGGEAPGPDGLSYDDLSSEDVWQMIRVLGRSLRTGEYRPGPANQIRVPKRSGRGWREISLSQIADRVVSRAIYQVVEPLLDASFDEASFCRSRSGAPRAVAYALAVAGRHRLFCWVADDIKNAFPSVPVNRLRDVLKKRLPDSRLLELLDRVLGASPGKGLAQGCSLSPLLLNVYLDHLLDHKWRRTAPSTPLVRYVDDILVLCRTAEEAREAYEQLRKLLRQAGFSLKGDGRSAAIHDLSAGERLDWLGYRFEMEGCDVAAKLPLDEEPDGFWNSLQQSFFDLHRRPDAAMLFPAVLEGHFFGPAAPCYAHHCIRDVYGRTRSIARDCGFEEMPSFSYFDQRWCEEYAAWDHRRQGIAIPFLSDDSDEMKHIGYELRSLAADAR